MEEVKPLVRKKKEYEYGHEGNLKPFSEFSWTAGILMQRTKSKTSSLIGWPQIDSFWSRHRWKITSL